MNFKEKYLKYKNKYLFLKNQLGGSRSMHRFTVGNKEIGKFKTI